MALTLTYLNQISEYATFPTTGDSLLYWGIASMCGCRDSSPHVRSVPYLFGEGNNLSEFPVDTCITKVSGFSTLGRFQSIVTDTSHLGETFVVKDVSSRTFTCAHCMSRRPKRDTVTYTLVGANGKELVISQSELDQNPLARGWARADDKSELELINQLADLVIDRMRDQSMRMIFPLKLFV
jgi:hypothetical protein